jgi:hypothetical protein
MSIVPGIAALPQVAEQTKVYLETRGFKKGTLGGQETTFQSAVIFCN